MGKKQILQNLADFIKIQSVSTDKSRYRQILQAVAFLENKLKSLGFKIRLLKQDNSPPLIIAQKFVKGGQKTIGIYGHYDVQPEDPVEEWHTLPFDLTIRQGKFFGRGVADNKGHIIQNIAAIEYIIKNKLLQNNIVFILEGEEETGSITFEKYVQEVKNDLKNIDVFYLTDVGMHQKNVAQIFYGLRGLLYFEIKIQTGKRDLHSGVYGNRVLNPAQILSCLFAKIKDEKTGYINIPHFYDDLRKPAKSELEILAKTKKSDEEEKQEANVEQLISVDQKYPYLSAKIYPSFDIHGIYSGYIKEGSKTIIPSSAIAKFSFRLIENQDPEKDIKSIFEAARSMLKRTVASSHTVESI